MVNQKLPKAVQVSDVASISTEELLPLIDSDYEVLCTVAVSEALGLAAPEVSQALERPERCEQWLDALLGVTGTLEVGVKRMRYELGSHHPKTRHNQRRLGVLRARTQQARRVARAYRAGPPSAPRTPSTTVGFKMRAWLTGYFAEEFRALHAEECAAAGIDPRLTRIPESDNDLVPWALALGFLTAPASPHCRQLLQFGPASSAWRKVVADDAKHQQTREPVLRHPLLLVPWGEMLTTLRHMTLDFLGYKEPDGLVTTVVINQTDLRYHLPDEAFRTLNALRFLAALDQRQYEQRSLIRLLRRVIGDRYQEAREQVGVPEAANRAIDRLADRHPDVAAFFADLLNLYADKSGKLTSEFFANAGGIKQEAFARAAHLPRQRVRST